MSHPLENFSFCPRCGSRSFVVNDFKSRRCVSCGFVYYGNPSAATACFITNERGELLVARRGKEPARGTLDLVGGFIDQGETAEEGIAREIREESGLEVSRVRYLFSLPNVYRYSGMDINTLDLFFAAEADSGARLRADDDVAELMWMAVKDVSAALFGLNSVSRAVQRWLDERAGD